MRLCGKRNTHDLDRLARPDWLQTDVLAMCRLPHGHRGDCHWRIPHSISGAHPERDRLVEMAAIAREVGAEGAAAVDAAWAALAAVGEQAPDDSEG